MTGSQSIVLRLHRRKGGKWRIGILVTSTKARTRYSLTSAAEIKRLPDGLFAAGRVIEDSMLPRLAEIVGRNDAPNMKAETRRQTPPGRSA
jgi:hypothetical protein